ncbi:hypothetical protein GLOIN_2v1713867 [Rhizophagus irregularis DAOM 181602=DAOM 197198]|uniref:Uncharacterized protein n=1 Tax=Rhizophagus irregularis (strain DAOM 181602 / DAOM 197198 / MUCL 43194) TaxID=747089 RepID=A0A2P4P4S6_RHIID|nr:hypothetical protein GLOIN_2v1713867 [Rhizophagus irregularis DAOM 181602=DAOM 197198]POG60385.1 hypothetical protein GLOIN_2v1713867 [Rhizophagus irregularis DAOM 181602=DAOM 197198]GET64156.1 hypothetical protein GLOIN_2v1713867 [Rhizophagus irregularis DAOM 181602=DAOM 197198]|eukprot:XP_025167251.1 hypothetical protein GLOIN_2v1713867 [Rhizophagus irregularis DAOM 181602=DAOM 197198]
MIHALYPFCLFGNNSFCPFMYTVVYSFLRFNIEINLKKIQFAKNFFLDTIVRSTFHVSKLIIMYYNIQTLCLFRIILVSF